jgi:glycosyltransferase involved in cell wall biosynthesis
MKKQPVPVIHTFHGHLLDDPEFSGFKSRVIIEVERMLARKSAKLVTVGRRVADELLEQHIGNKDQFINIPPGVVALNVTPKEQALKSLNLPDDGKQVVGWIARVTGVKNPMLALEVAHAMPNTHFVMAGGGDLLERVKAAAPPNVSVVGWAKAENLLGASEIILSTSENEGMPVALIEAQLAGKPVVAINVGSVSEIVMDGKNGFLVSKNVPSVVDRLNLLLSDPDKRIAFGEFALKSSARFSINLMIDEHVRLYEKFIP